MTKKFSVASLLAMAVVFGSVKQASADTIQFTNFTHSGASAVDWLVTIDDDTTGVFTVNVGIAGSSPNQFADITGVAFSIKGALSKGLQASHIVDATVVTDYEGSYTGPDDKFGQVSFRGGTPAVGLFDAALGYKSGPLFLKSVKFTVSTLNGLLGLDDWAKFGVRGQSVGATDFGGGSSKDWSTTTAAVPTPSAMMSLLGLGVTLGGLTFWRKRQK